MLPCEGRRHPSIARFGEIAVPWPTDEPAVARRLEPSTRLAIRDDRLRRSLLLELTTTAAAVAPMPPSIPLVEIPPAPAPTPAASLSLPTSALAPLIIGALTLVLTAALECRTFSIARRAILIAR